MRTKRMDISAGNPVDGSITSGLEPSPSKMMAISDHSSMGPNLLL